jgi:DNA end-binding protein Ku
MASRPIWRGHLRLALVTCPVAIYSAKTERNTIRFNLINPATGHRIRMMTVDAETDEEVSRRELVKGYEFSKNRYLLLTDADLNSVKVESSSVMAVEKFVEANAIDPIYYENAYYLAPDGDAGRDVYFVLREAVRRTGKVALSRVVIGQRERMIALRPYDKGLAGHTLSEQGDLNDAKQLFDGEVPVDEEMVKLAVELMQRQTAPYDPSDIEDRYEKRLREMIEAKLKGEGITDTGVAEPVQTNVVDLMSALKQSLATSTRAPATAEKEAPAPRRKTGKAPARKRA